MFDMHVNLESEDTDDIEVQQRLIPDDIVRKKQTNKNIYPRVKFTNFRLHEC